MGAGSYSVVKECVHIDTGRYYAAKVINKRLMAGREHMVRNEIAVLKRVSMVCSLAFAVYLNHVLTPFARATRTS